MSKSTEGKTYCCNFGKGVEDNKQIFKNKMLINRIHKCKFVDILMKAQYIGMYERIECKHNQTMETHKVDIEFKNRRNQSKREAYHKSKNKNKLDNEQV